MSTDREDDALRWGDESDPTYIASGTPASTPSTAGPSTAEGRSNAPVSGHDTPSRTTETPAPTATTATAEALPVATNSALLVTLGILGGVYLLYTVGWVIIAINPAAAVPVDAFDVIMAQLREYLAVVAPLIWFTTTLLLTRGHRPVTRLLWLLIGVVVLVPLPFVLGS